MLAPSASLQHLSARTATEETILNRSLKILAAGLAVALCACGGERDTLAAACASAEPAGPDQAFDAPPMLSNALHMSQTFRKLYDKAGLARGGHTPRQVLLSVWLNETGGVYRSQVQQSGGTAQHDSVAVRLSRQFRFTPAQKGGAAVCAQVSMPVDFPPR